MFQSSKGLLEIERKLLADSDVEEAKCFDTVASKLGRLLMEKAIKVRLTKHHRMHVRSLDPLLAKRDTGARVTLVLLAGGGAYE